MARKMNRKAKKYLTLQSGIALMIAISIVVNLFGAFISFRMDFTEQKLYSLSRGTVSVLNGLDDVVTVKLYASKELPSQVSLIYRDVKDTLQDYKNASHGKIQLIQKFPDADDKAAEDAQGQGIQPVQFNVVKSDEYSVKQGFLGISLEFGDKKEAIPFVKQTDDLEYNLTSLIRKITTNKETSVLFTSGHGEKDINQELQGLNQELSKQYKIVSADKKNFSKQLKEADVLISAGPKQKFSETEINAITNFINEGKSGLFLVDNIDVNPQYLMANPNQNNVNEIINQFGINVNKDLVYDLKSPSQVNVPSNQGLVYAVNYPLWPQLTTNSQNIITRQLKSFPLAWTSSVDLLQQKLGNAKAEPLLQTTNYANHQTSNYNVSFDGKTNVYDQKNLKQFITGYAVNGVGRNSGRLVVIGDADFLMQQSSGVLISNSIDWLSQDELLIGIRSKNAQPNQLIFKSEATKNFVRYFNMIGLVVIVVAFGLWHMNRRRNLSKAYIM